MTDAELMTTAPDVPGLEVTVHSWHVNVDGMIEDKDGILIAWCADGTIWIWSMNTKNWVPFDSIPPRKEEDLK